MDPAVCIVLGTRPEIIKMAPVVRELEERDVPFTLLHTGQHYSDNLDGVFFRQLQLPEPDYNLGVGSGSHAEQTAAMLTGIEDVVTEEESDVILVQGDTNSVLAGGLVASKLPIQLGHVEAGLRSFDRRMPEEVNRKLVDHAADFLFAPTSRSSERLLEEGIPRDRVFETGNTVVDAVHDHVEIARSESAILDDLELTEGQYILLTAHRAENVDDPATFKDILDGVRTFAQETGYEVIYPIHPRARERLQEFDLDEPPEIRFVEPQDYLDFLKLQSGAAIVLTDSGGVQEETCILEVPCVTLRDNTERPETVDVGANVLAGTEPESIVESGWEMYNRVHSWENPFGDGTSSSQIVDIVLKDHRPQIRETVND